MSWVSYRSCWWFVRPIQRRMCPGILAFAREFDGVSDVARCDAIEENFGIESLVCYSQDIVNVPEEGMDVWGLVLDEVLRRGVHESVCEEHGYALSHCCPLFLQEETSIFYVDVRVRDDRLSSFICRKDVNVPHAFQFFYPIDDWFLGLTCMVGGYPTSATCWGSGWECRGWVCEVDTTVNLLTPFL